MILLLSDALLRAHGGRGTSGAPVKSITGAMWRMTGSGIR